MIFSRLIGSLVLCLGVVLLGAAPAHSQDQLQARALLQAVQKVKVSSEIQARVNELPWLEGDRFKKDDLLIGFDCRLLQARAAMARAVVKGERKTVENKRQLMTLQSAGELEVALAQAALEKAKGELDGALYAVEQCKIPAPFDGRVVRKNVNRFETVAPGDGLLEILDDSNLEITLVVPSNWLSWVNLETAFNLRIDETGKVYEAHVKRIGAQIDPVSQSVSLYGAIDNMPAQGELIAGMSGTATFSYSGSSTQ